MQIYPSKPTPRTSKTINHHPLKSNSLPQKLTNCHGTSTSFWWYLKSFTRKKTMIFSSQICCKPTIQPTNHPLYAMSSQRGRDLVVHQHRDLVQSYSLHVAPHCKLTNVDPRQRPDHMHHDIAHLGGAPCAVGLVDFQTDGNIWNKKTWLQQTCMTNSPMSW